MSERLLTEEKIVSELNCSKGIVDTYDPNIIQAAKDVAIAQDKATLKAVWEWLNKKGIVLVPKEQSRLDKDNNVPIVLVLLGFRQEVTETELEAFKHGEMPEDGK